MSGKKSKSSNVKMDNKIVDSEKVPFPVWFAGQVKASKLQFWQEQEISVFFKEKGLSDKEEPDKYSELLKLY